MLRRAGRETFASTLTGLGERSHLLTAEIDLTAHINDIVWAQSRLGDQPIQTFTQPVVISSQIIIPTTHIQCSEAPFFKEAATRAKEQGFRYHDLLSAGHEAMITRPEELAQILLQV